VASGRHTTIEVAGREVRLSNPDKVFFPEAGHTKLDLANYYLEVADAAVLHLRERPTTMKRFVDGAAGDFFFQKRVPKGAPDWLETATVRFPSGRSARELVANDAAHLVWAVNLDPLLELAARDEAEGLGDAPWPPHFPKQRGEQRRVQPSKARRG
jgi:bifunctional non-homologous end joining protein LigD